jgi:sugar phosphate isomerase/epimerase
VLALSTGSLYTYGTERVFGLAKEAGFDGVEMMIDQRWDTRQPDYLNRLKERYALPIASVHAPFVFGIPGWPTSGVESCKRAVALAEAVGARTVVMHTPLRMTFVHIAWPALRQKPLNWWYPRTLDKEHLRWLDDGLAAFQKTTPVTIAVENLPYRRQWFGLYKSLWHRNTPDDWAKLEHWTLDTTHVGTWGHDLLALYERLKRRLAHIHLSNHNQKETPDEHRLLHDGHLPLGELLQRLSRDGYTGIITCELDPGPLGAADEGVVKENLRKTVEFCRENLRGGLAA